MPRGATQGPREWDGPRVALLQAATLLGWFLTLTAVRITGECSNGCPAFLFNKNLIGVEWSPSIAIFKSTPSRCNRQARLRTTAFISRELEPLLVTVVFKG